MMRNKRNKTRIIKKITNKLPIWMTRVTLGVMVIFNVLALVLSSLFLFGHVISSSSSTSAFAKSNDKTVRYEDLPYNIRNHVLLRGNFIGHEGEFDEEPAPKSKPSSKPIRRTCRAHDSKAARQHVPSPNLFENALEGLLNLSEAADVSNPSTKRVRRERESLLEAYTDKLYSSEKRVDYGRYFDCRNIETLGEQFLLRCIGDGHNFLLAQFLIEIGAKLHPEDPETLQIISFSVIQEGNPVSRDILLELLKTSPLSIARAFTSIECERADFYFLSMLAQTDESYILSSLSGVIDILARSGRMKESLNFIRENYPNRLPSNSIPVIDLLDDDKNYLII